MSGRERASSERDVLPAEVAERLLRRATLLDTARADMVSVSDLRAGAAEAGISRAAFDTALAELHAEASGRSDARAGGTMRRRRVRRLGAVAALAIAAAVAGVVQLRHVRQTPVTSLVEETILVRCLAPEDAAELVRPVLDDGQSSATIHRGNAFRAIRIRATPAAMRRVKALLAEQERGPLRSCTAPSMPATEL